MLTTLFAITLIGGGTLVVLILISHTREDPSRTLKKYNESPRKGSKHARPLSDFSWSQGDNRGGGWQHQKDDEGNTDNSSSLTVEVIQRWARVENSAPDSDTLKWLTKTTGIPFKTLDFARRVRNEAAHGGTYVPVEKLRRAAEILRDAESSIRRTGLS